LPVNLGLLDKLWSVQVAGCAFKEPLKSVVDGGNFKTMDLLAYLRNEHDNSKPYNKLKLMLLGRSEVGKTALLTQLRQEGQVPKGSLQSDSWSARLGHQTKSSSKSSNTSNSAQQKVKLHLLRLKPKTFRSEANLLTSLNGLMNLRVDRQNPRLRRISNKKAAP
jgi:hypothetical protein